MIEVGRERDKRIAHWRGDICEYPTGKALPYSTDFVAVMMLWREMKEAGLQPWLMTLPSGKVNCLIHLIDSDGKAVGGIAEIGKDEADAISAVYFRWQEYKITGII